MIVRFEFHGGCRDGTVVIGEDDLRLGADKNPAHVYLVLAEGGRIGARFREPLPTSNRRAKREEFTAVVWEYRWVGRLPERGWLTVLRMQEGQG